MEKNSLVSARGLVVEDNLIDVKSLLPSNSCSMPDNGMIPSKLKLVHRYGPCSPLVYKEKLSVEEINHQIFKEDQARFEYINRMYAKNTTSFNPLGNNLPTQVPVESVNSLGSGNFIVTIGLGTPSKTFSVIFDTVLSLKDPIFNPKLSSTFANISCSSDYCIELDRHGCSRTSHCLYKVKYGDGSQTRGYLIRDTLLFSSNVIRNFLFGCGHHNHIIGEKPDGLLGFGRGPVLFISQTAKSYGMIFSYCLLEDQSTVGFLELDNHSFHVEYTSMIIS
ncbi:hypothetical protein IEQ34_007434 [Dendrobium chrysotoxum]|uniref:Peptidase A1 domain-containing protein n=1 Tax=Dendrobium chrysotoxum TaxID=161865 RepID=A0AAV7HAP9_DENCH|nr:hypothetical protein IEQ34_007434 [Dendrobium chrysotoxum]